MAKQHHSAHQQRIIKNYYKNKDDIQNQKLGEIIAEIYLAETDKKKASLWKRVEKTLTHLEVHPTTIKFVVEKQDLETLSEIASELF